MTFDPSKPVAAEHGRPVRILVSDLNAPYPIVAAHTEQDGRETPYTHYSDGSFILPQYNLHNVPERVTDEKFVGRLSSTGYVYLDLCEPNVRFTFEGDMLVAVELIGDE